MVYRVGRAFRRVDDDDLQPVALQLRPSLTWGRDRDGPPPLVQHSPDHVGEFCEPRSPRHRGTNESTNGLLIPILPEKAPTSPSTLQTTFDALLMNSANRPANPLTTGPRIWADQSPTDLSRSQIPTANVCALRSLVSRVQSQCTDGPLHPINRRSSRRTLSSELPTQAAVISQRFDTW